MKGKGRKGKRRGKEVNLLDLRPKRTKKWRRGDKVSIAVPRARTIVGKHFCDALGIERTYRINLDDYGSAVWNLCDGMRTVREIGEGLRDRFGEKVEPLYERLGKFIAILKNNDLIRFAEDDG